MCIRDRSLDSFRLTLTEFPILTLSKIDIFRLLYLVNKDLCDIFRIINFNNYDFLKTTSRIFFIEIVNTLKNTKKRPNQPNMTAIDNMFEPKSRCSKFCI